MFRIRSTKPRDPRVGTMNSNESGYDPMDGSYEAADELSVSTELWKFLSSRILINNCTRRSVTI